MNRIRTSQVVTVAATAAAVAVAATVAVAVGWALAAGPDDPPTDPAAAPAVDSSRTPGAPVSGSPPPPGQAGSPDPTPPPDQSDSGGQPDQPAEGPRIDLFQVTQEPRCPGGTTQNPIDGQPVMLEWRVTGADAVTISIDGEGIFDTYPAEGGSTFSFGCDADAGDVAEHTFLLTVVADGPAVTETIVVSARVNEVPEA